jgi:hypothetical protein
MDSSFGRCALCHLFTAQVNIIPMKKKKIVLILAISMFFIVYTFLIQFFTRFHELQNADSILLSIMSYTKPTLFFWGQNQYLNFFPILFSFVSDPVLNLFGMSSTQIILVIFFPLMAGFLLFPGNQYGIWTISLVFMAVLNHVFWFESCYQPYVVSLSVALGGSFFLFQSMKSKRQVLKQLLLAASAFLAVIALKIAQPVIFIILIWNIYLIARDQSLLGSENTKLDLTALRQAATQKAIWFGWFALAFILFAILENQLCSHLVKRPMLLNLNTSQIVHTFIKMARNLLVLDRYYLFSLGSILVTMIGYAVMIIHKQFRTIAQSLILFVLPAVIIALLMSSLEWVRTNNCPSRYIFFCVYLLVLNHALLCTESVKILRIPRKITVYTCILGIALIVVFFSFHPSHLRGIRDRIGHQYGYSNEQGGEYGKDGAIGEFWKVWPYVWLKNASGSNNFIGISYRSDPIFEQILEKLKNQGHLELFGFDDENELVRWSTTWFAGFNFHKHVLNNKFVLIVDAWGNKQVPLHAFRKSSGAIPGNTAVILKPNEYLNGPCCTLKGKYRVIFQISGKPGSKVFIKATSHAQKKIFFSQKLQFPQNVEFLQIPVLLKLEQLAYDFEFPVYNQGDTDITVESISIEKIW